MHTPSRWIRACLAALALSFGAAAQAQAWPDRPVRLVVPFSAGGLFDTLARLLGQGLAERLGQPVVIDNRPGAGGTIAADHVAKSAADGYTLLVGDIGTNAIAPALYDKLPYDAVADFLPVNLSASSALVLVTTPAFPAKDLRELIDAAKARPGQLNYASSGQGGISHLAVEMLRSMAKVDMVHVPYKGSAPALTDVVSGQVQMMIPSVSSALPHIQAGRLKAIAVTTSARSPVLPDVPTMHEAGLSGYGVDAWIGVLAPAGTPAPVVDRLNRELAAVLAAPAVAQRLSAMGLDVVDKGPQAFSEHLRSEVGKWGAIVKNAGLRAQ